MTGGIRRSLLMACMALAVAAIAAPMVVPPAVRIVFNASDSVARGWYRIDAADDHDLLHAGRLVLARLPADAAAFAAQRGYLLEGVPVLKRVGAMAPQSVCVSGRTVRIGGVTVARALTHDGQLRPLEAWAQCRRLGEGELFLLGEHPASFDSRYFGPVDVSAVLGVAQPLWTW